MNEPNQNPDDGQLHRLLRECRPSPALTPGLQEAVWRRIEDSEGRADAGPDWLAALTAWVLRPRYAMAVASVIILLGAVLGARDGWQAARRDAQTRYLASVSPNVLE